MLTQGGPIGGQPQQPGQPQQQQQGVAPPGFQ